MRLALLLFASILAGILPLWAQPPSPTVKPGSDYSQEAFVTEHYMESFRFESDGTGRQQTEARVKVKSESGVQRFGQLRVGYSALSDKLEIVYVRVIKSDGTTVNAPESGIQDVTFPNALMYSDYHERHISVAALRPGDVLEYQYVRTIVNPLTPGEFWASYSFENRDIVLDEQLEINVPKARQLKLKNEPGYVPAITEEGDRRIYHWKHSHLVNEEESAKKKPAPQLDEDKVPSVQLTTFESWQQLGDWYAGLEKDRRQPTDAVKAKTAELVQGKNTDAEKVKALYGYVSRDFRYVSLSFGLGRYQPHAAAEVLANGYGDCKDKNTLLAALLAAQGFESTSVLIGSQHKLDADIPSPLQFDHVITRVPVERQEIWLDSTTGAAPFRMLPFPLRDKQALAVPPGGKPELVRTPANLPFASFEHTRIEGSVNETGKLTAHFNDLSRGDTELALRIIFRQLPNNKWKSIFETAFSQSRMKGGEITNFKVGDLATTDNPLEIDFDISVNNYFDWASPDPKLSLPLVGIEFRPPSEGDDSKNPKPIKLGPATEASSEVKVAIPARFGVRLPFGVDVKRDYAEYHSSYKFENGQLSATRRLHSLVPEIPYERREDFAAFCRAVDADQAQSIALEGKSPAGSGPGANESADDLYEAAVQAMKNHNYDMAIDLFQRVLKTDPHHKGLRNNLSSCYRSTNQYGKAADISTKQIEANPYDELAYNELGLADEAMQRWDDAIVQFKKQAEVNPLDPRAHANLGYLYVRMKRYTDAVPELEKAASIQPNNPDPLAALGEAYIAAGEEQKGMDSFDKAISLAPRTWMWARIAHDLARQNVQLSRADQYADTAINVLETQLRVVTLANLRYEDLETTRMLFDVWATKGSVMLKRGELDKADSYIFPALLASGSGTHAYEMGELGEARGLRDKAIQYYAMSLAVHNPTYSGRTKLEDLGITGNPETLAKESLEEIKRQRTVNLDVSETGTADFFLLVSPGKIEDVKFVKGDQNLGVLSEKMKSMPVAMKFPPSSQVHVVRRVTVRCGVAVPSPKPIAKLKATGKAGATAPSAKSEGSTSAPNESITPGPCTVDWLPTTAVFGIY